jgi:hypothetical protein
MDKQQPGPRALSRSLAIVALGLTPALAAVWSVRWFVTQDGPAHVYNASILAASLHADSPYRAFYEVHWRPLPNWAGHLALMGLLQIVSPRIADKILTSLTLAGFAASIAWLRAVVERERPSQTGGEVDGDAPAGWGPWIAPSLLTAILGLNMTWLFGFTSFLLGASLFPITLGIWWGGRNQLSPSRAVALMGLIVAGYFAHLVSLGLTVVGLLVLAITSPRAPLRAHGATSPSEPNPGESGPTWRARMLWTLAGISPLALLGPLYLVLAHNGGETPHPVWKELSDPTSPLAWLARLSSWVDPISLTAKTSFPFTNQSSRGFVWLAPALWFAEALICWAALPIDRRLRARQAARVSTSAGRDESSQASVAQQPAHPDRGWWVLAGLLILGGLFGPDSFGPTHGEYLPQRVVLLGLVALVPVFRINPVAARSTRLEWVVVGALAIALALQSLVVWDYALYSNQTAGSIAEAAYRIGQGQRIATLLDGIRSRFRANPLLHADNWLGVGNGNIVWSNYETRHYYFPVHFRPSLDHPDPATLEAIAIFDEPADAETRATAWENLLDRYANAIDVVVSWKANPRLEVITARRFAIVDQVSDLRIFRKRPAPQEGEVHDAP